MIKILIVLSAIFIIQVGASNAQVQKPGLLQVNTQPDGLNAKQAKPVMQVSAQKANVALSVARMVSLNAGNNSIPIHKKGISISSEDKSSNSNLLQVASTGSLNTKLDLKEPSGKK